MKYVETEILLWLQSWCSKQCDGHWEKNKRINIETLDNPGWLIRIYLDGTSLEKEHVDIIKKEVSDDDWAFYWVDEGVFHARGGPKNLTEMLNLFKNWAEKKS